MANTYWEQRQKETRDRRYWMHTAKYPGLVVDADSYADALRFKDLIEDGLTVEEAEADSGATLI